MKTISFTAKDKSNSNLGTIKVLSITQVGIHGRSERVKGLISLHHYEIELYLHRGSKTEIVEYGTKDD